MAGPSATHTEEDVEKYRDLAEKLLRERYEGNQAAFARDLSIGAANIHRFVIKRSGGISSRTAERLVALAASKTPSVVPASVRRPHDDELEKTIDFFEGRWPGYVVETARLLAKNCGLQKDRNAWIEALEMIEACLDELVNKLK
jgi:hypothetical protein